MVRREKQRLNRNLPTDGLQAQGRPPAGKRISDGQIRSDSVPCKPKGLKLATRWEELRGATSAKSRTMN